PGPVLPDAAAVLDPKRNDCSYPYDELCGCGIGFKLIQALAQRRSQAIEDLIPYLDLVAAAIGADIVPITGENRILAKFGMEVINADPRPGFKAITQNLKKKELTITDVVFIIAPRINAAGRIKHGNYAVRLLTEFGIEEAEAFAREIETFNADRKELDRQITIEALSQIAANKEEKRFSTVVYQEDWHKGVIGIVASRLIETYYRPTLVFTKSGGRLAASARSVKDFDVYNALEACSDYLEQFGGHMYAAGLTLKEEQFENFKNRFEKVVSETIAEELLMPEIAVDAEISLADINDKFIRILKQFEPFGPMNMTPIFLTNNLIDTGYGKAMGESGEHLKLFVKQGNSQGFPAVGFKIGHKLEIVKNRKPFQAVYSIDENEFNGSISLQMRLRDIKEQ
ncbi:MAG TPA: DHHA1 domain-containing protein, partial [Flavobacterium sp.]|nr:DHHA1 domain-containing protein [Flavobacterium sp.]